MKVLLKKILKPKMNRNKAAKYMEMRMAKVTECRGWDVTKAVEQGIEAPT